MLWISMQASWISMQGKGGWNVFCEGLSLIDTNSSYLRPSAYSTRVKCPHSVYIEMFSSDQCQKWNSPDLICYRLAPSISYCITGYNKEIPPWKPENLQKSYKENFVPMKFPSIYI